MTDANDQRSAVNRTETAAVSLLVERTDTSLRKIENGFPYFADHDTGEWTVTDDGNWCGGHWIGMLWLAHEQTGEDRYAEAAERYTARMLDSIPTENMFYGMNANYAGFRAYDITNLPRHRSIGIKGADKTVEYFHEGAQQVPLGTLSIEAPASNFRGPDGEDGPSGARLGAVDAIYTALPVLWRAYRETGTERYRNIAISHADRHLDWYIRSDGSTWHHTEFDPDTGELIRQYNELAYADDTCWARGQGWCIAGLARAYQETEAGRYFKALRRVVDYYVANTPVDLVPYWDFEHPDAPNVERDTSAAALAAYGLSRLPETQKTERLVDVGERILRSLVNEYLTPLADDDGRPPGIVRESCYNGPANYAHRHEHVWTDYYVFYSLARRIADGD